MAREVLQELLKLDPTDPLNVAAWLDEMATDGKTVVRRRIAVQVGESAAILVVMKNRTRKNADWADNHGCN